MSLFFISFSFGSFKTFFFCLVPFKIILLLYLQAFCFPCLYLILCFLLDSVFLKNYLTYFPIFLDVSSFVVYLHIAHVKQARWYVFSLALLTISVGDIPSKHPPHRGPYSLDKTSLKGVSTNFECRLIIYSYSGRRSLQAIKEKLFKLTASLDFYVYVYPFCLTAWYKSKLKSKVVFIILTLIVMQTIWKSLTGRDFHAKKIKVKNI